MTMKDYTLNKEYVEAQLGIDGPRWTSEDLNVIGAMLHACDTPEEARTVFSLACRIGIAWQCWDCDSILIDFEESCCGIRPDNIMYCQCGNVHVAMAPEIHSNGCSCPESAPRWDMMIVTYVPQHLQETARATGSWNGCDLEAVVTVECAKEFEGMEFVKVEGRMLRP